MLWRLRNGPSRIGAAEYLAFIKLAALRIRLRAHESARQVRLTHRADLRTSADLELS